MLFRKAFNFFDKAKTDGLEVAKENIKISIAQEELPKAITYKRTGRFLD